jgi:hypothetical protein
MGCRRDEEGRCRRGSSNSTVRGSAEARTRRHAWIVETFSVGGVLLCQRPGCEVPLLEDGPQGERFEVDRWPMTGRQGGGYVRGNIRPICQPCNLELGNAERDGLVV